jgi:hypothetical protein
MPDELAAERELEATPSQHFPIIVAKAVLINGGLEVSLSPWATAAIFGPAEGWPPPVVPLHEVWQRAGGEVEESLAALPSWAARFEMLDHILGVSIPLRCGPPGKLRWAWNEVNTRWNDRSPYGGSGVWQVLYLPRSSGAALWASSAIVSFNSAHR